MFQSETYEVLDTLYHDEMTSDTTSKYDTINATLTYSSDGYITMTRSADGESVVNYNVEGATKTAEYVGKKVHFEFEIVNADNGIVPRIMTRVGSSWTSANGTTKITGVASVEKTIPSDCDRIFFRVSGNNLGTNGECSFKNFRVYPV